jgi:hypothetical protein
MRRILWVLIAVLVSAALAGPVVAARPQPRVAIIVGPVGDLTDYYRSIGADAAREARRWTSDVVSVVSPNATWPAVKRALRGASVVVYLGHGNGWPSPYRDALYAPTQDGLGLNPVAGGGDSAHQYFGEAYLAREVRLAPGAVVLLHHLCYASGNSEPGLPEGSLDTARQRVDNYAAGWLRAGAAAVIADTFGAPGPYLRALFGSNAAIDRIWRDAPLSHDHVLTFPSSRSPGYRAALDPTHIESGFNRSLVTRPGLTAADVRDGAGRVATGSLMGPVVAGSSTVASLASLGVTFRAPGLASADSLPSGLVAGTLAHLSLPVKVPKGLIIPGRIELAARWDPVALDQPAGSDAGAPAGPTTSQPGASPSPGPSAPPGSALIPDSGPSPTAGDTVGEPPAIALVAPEVVGSVVTPTRAILFRGRLVVSVRLPNAPGRYRLVTTIHGADGVAFDAATQVLIPALSVRVSPPLSAAFGVTQSLSVPAGARVDLPVRVANDGSLPWAGRRGSTDPSSESDPSVVRGHPTARLVARWMPLTSIDQGDGVDASASSAIQLDPGAEVTVVLALTAPDAPGAYLLVLDIDSPLHGSLAASGVAPGTVLVTVVPAATPAAP